MNEWYADHKTLINIIALAIVIPPFIYAMVKIYNNDISDGWSNHI